MASLFMDAERSDERRRISARSGDADHTANLHLESCGFPSSLMVFVPEANPRPWVWINISLAISGCILLLDLIYARDAWSERPFANGFDLLWEFSTCFFWTIETSLSATYQRYHLHVPIEWYTKLEIAIAGYFLISMIWMVVQWNITEDKGQEAIWEIALDTSFYVYLAIKGCRRSGSETTPESDKHNNPTYQTMDSNGTGVFV